MSIVTYRCEIPISTDEESWAALFMVSQNDLVFFESSGQERKTNIVVARSDEGIISKVATNICLNNFSADSFTGDEIFILTLRASFIAACHNVFQGRKISGLKI